MGGKDVGCRGFPAPPCNSSTSPTSRYLPEWGLYQGREQRGAGPSNLEGGASAKPRPAPRFPHRARQLGCQPRCQRRHKNRLQHLCLPSVCRALGLAFASWPLSAPLAMSRAGKRIGAQPGPIPDKLVARVALSSGGSRPSERPGQGQRHISCQLTHTPVCSEEGPTSCPWEVPTPLLTQNPSL